MKIRDFLPPVVLSAARRVLRANRARVFQSYAEAMSVCSQDGYENEAIIEVVVRKTIVYRDLLLSGNASCVLEPNGSFGLCSLMSALDRGTIRVLDFGGAAGAHYFLARRFLPSSIRLQWTVVETNAMAARARSALSGDELGFSDDLESAAAKLNQVDILYASGVLQCVNDPCQFLGRLLAISPRFLLLGRLGLTRGMRDLVTVHQSRLSSNGPGPMPPGMIDRSVSYPFVFPREGVLLGLLEKDYQVVAKLDDPSGVFPVRGEQVVGASLLACRKSEG